MLIFLDLSLVSNVNLTDADVDALEELLLYHSKFYHYVAATKRTAVQLASSLKDRLSRRGLQTLQTISAQSSDLVGILQNTTHYTSVQKSELAGCVVEKDGLRTRWVCGPQFAAKWFSQPSKFIGENLTDTKLFLAASIDFASSVGIDHRMQCFSGEMSGGCGNAAMVMSNRIAEGTAPVLCVIDSDKKSANFSASDSVKKCVAAADKMGGIAYFYPLSERELENVLPHAILEGAVLRLPVSLDRDAILARLELLAAVRKNKPSLYPYVDIKEGTCRRWGVANHVPEVVAAEVVSPCPCHKDCEGYVAPPLFKDLLEKAAQFTEHISKSELCNLLKNEARPAWSTLGRTVLSFSLSNNVRTT